MEKTKTKSQYSHNYLYIERCIAYIEYNIQQYTVCSDSCSLERYHYKSILKYVEEILDDFYQKLSDRAKDRLSLRN